MEPGAGGEPAGASRGNSAGPVPRHRLCLAAVRRWQLHCSVGDGKGSTEHVLTPSCIFHLCCRSSARAWHHQGLQPAETNWGLWSREGSSVQLEGCSKSAGKQPSSEQRKGPALCQGCALLQAQQGPAACARLHHGGDGRAFWYHPALCPCPSVFMAFTGEQNYQWHPRSQSAWGPRAASDVLTAFMLSEEIISVTDSSTQTYCEHSLLPACKSTSLNRTEFREYPRLNLEITGPEASGQLGSHQHHNPNGWQLASL